MAAILNKQMTKTLSLPVELLAAASERLARWWLVTIPGATHNFTPHFVIQLTKILTTVV